MLTTRCAICNVRQSFGVMLSQIITGNLTEMIKDVHLPLVKTGTMITYEVLVKTYGTFVQNAGVLVNLVTMQDGTEELALQSKKFSMHMKQNHSSEDTIQTPKAIVSLNVNQDFGLTTTHHSIQHRTSTIKGVLMTTVRIGTILTSFLIHYQLQKPVIHVGHQQMLRQALGQQKRHMAEILDGIQQSHLY
jgi:hypothetical protein